MNIPKLEIYREGSTDALSHRATRRRRESSYDALSRAPPAADAKVQPMRRAAAPPGAKNNL